VKVDDPVAALRNLASALSECDECQSPTVNDTDGPNSLCGKCWAKHVALRAEVERLRRVSETGTVEAWMELDESQKRQWFALAMDDSQRRKVAEVEVEELRAALEGLRPIAECVRGQDNRATSHPVYVVETKTGRMGGYEFVTAFFSEAAADAYVASNAHNLKKPRVFVYSAYRNREWQAVRVCLLALLNEHGVTPLAADAMEPGASGGVAMSGQDATVAAIAREWVRLHREAIRLRQERNAVDCEWAHPNEYDEVGRRTAPGVEPCFRDYSQPEEQPDYMPTTRPVSEWCPSCQRRNDLHLAYRATKKAEGIANRKLQALCRKERAK